MLATLRQALRLPLVLLVTMPFVAPLLTPLAAQAHEEQEERRVRLLPQWEFRQDVTVAREPGAHLGVGLNLRADYYVRLGVSLSSGAVRRDSDVWVGAQRLDLTARYLLDPFGERPRGWYGGAGVSVAQLPGQGASASLQLLVGLEGRPGKSLIPAVELGVGGGVRLGVVVRRKRPDRSR
jgi:hypothetical protein